MIPNDQPLRRETISRMIDTIEDNMDDHGDYSTWEIEFIQSISNQFQIRQDLSSKQCEILERIYDKI